MPKHHFVNVVVPTLYHHVPVCVRVCVRVRVRVRVCVYVCVYVCVCFVCVWHICTDVKLLLIYIY